MCEIINKDRKIIQGKRERLKEIWVERECVCKNKDRKIVQGKRERRLERDMG